MQRIKETNTLFLKERNMKFSAKLRKMKRKNSQINKIRNEQEAISKYTKIKNKIGKPQGHNFKNYCGGLNEIFLVVSGT